MNIAMACKPEKSLTKADLKFIHLNLRFVTISVFIQNECFGTFLLVSFYCFIYFAKYDTDESLYLE